MNTSKEWLSEAICHRLARYRSALREFNDVNGMMPDLGPGKMDAEWRANALAKRREKDNALEALNEILDGWND